MANVIGPDVSFYQDDDETPEGIDFVKMKASAGYVIIRAGQRTWPDPDFKVNWAAAKKAGLPRGSYWYYDSRYEPKKQADLWVAQYDGDFGELPLFADFEESYGGAYAGWKNWYTFLERVKGQVNGKEISIYTAYYYWRDNAPNSTSQAANLNYFRQYPLWIAHYKVNTPKIPLPWTEWLFWQYTEGGDGKLYGVESKGIDLNYFNGDLDALKARFNLSDTPAPEPEPEPIPDDGTTAKQYIVTASPSLRVRKGPGTTYEVIGSLYYNEKVEEISANSDRSWLEVVRLPDKALKGWCFASYLKNTDGSPTPTPSNFVSGPDVSFYQDDPETPQGIDFKKMKVSANYVIIRAGQNLWPDPDFKVNWSEAKKAGLPRGSYWFYDSRAEPKKQAELWVKQFNGDFGELPLFADFEESYNGQYKGWQNWYTFLERLKELVNGKEIAIYTAYYYWRDNAPNAGTANLEYFHKYPLWIANYGAAAPQVPSPWKNDEWLFWQYTETGDGKLYGVESNGIDLNYFNGDLEDFKTRFKITDPGPDPDPDPNPDPDPDPGTPTGKIYKVTANPSLKVRTGPGTSYNSIGLLLPNEQVEEIGANTDRSWLRIVRLPDKSLTGWCFAAYLRDINSTEPDPGTPPSRPNEYADKPWYKVNVQTLPVRDTPNTSGKLLGSLAQDDTIPVLDTTNPSWFQIYRLDGLTGWCEKKYLTFLQDSRPISTRQNFFKGITYLRKDLTIPRKLVVHVLAIDLQTQGLEFLATPSNRTDGIICSRTTSQFVEEFGVHVAINADGFSYLSPNTYPAATYCSKGGEPLKINGFAASRGKIVSPTKTVQPTVYISQGNVVSINVPPGKVFNAVTGDRVIVQKGAVVKNLAALGPNPRTALGINKNGRWLILMTVDGREFGVSEGVTLPELASLLMSYGVTEGVNMDGGGSSSMVVRGIDGEPRTLNTAIDQNVPGKERAVANHLGIFVKK